MRETRHYLRREGGRGDIKKKRKSHLPIRIDNKMRERGTAREAVETAETSETDIKKRKEGDD